MDWSQSDDCEEERCVCVCVTLFMPKKSIYSKGESQRLPVTRQHVPVTGQRVPVFTSNMHVSAEQHWVIKFFVTLKKYYSNNFIAARGIQE